MSTYTASAFEGTKMADFSPWTVTSAVLLFFFTLWEKVSKRERLGWDALLWMKEKKHGSICKRECCDSHHYEVSHIEGVYSLCNCLRGS